MTVEHVNIARTGKSLEDLVGRSKHAQKEIAVRGTSNGGVYLPVCFVYAVTRNCVAEINKINNTFPKKLTLPKKGISTPLLGIS